ncbi:bifunctional (p)ppGpp synthetase/guanosine-3',5'-bis(diphosphate) 3'-pyrophosphohydrolase [Desulforhopalus vacuolatus]|uniref:HD domain-containing protein n=1 Tax=Desulforhopalus vacuolatus TaxID=40414 RepID=UPI00196479C9|nr:HD domain-containing protein [Desulforhopalus vacuolatus]MBM9521134.1 bifunctional (p)ppGpp synthetase/guanosine-3',5'-bis(diphosphate) 3'-pyrophosphohydrolase [Desulforhopalus vacuolatus]
MQHIPFNLELYRTQMQGLIGHVEGASVFWSALDFATVAHRDQWRKSGDAYILHPCSVARILIKEMDVEHPEILAAALLHDTVEDVDNVTPEVVEEKFGFYVRAIVEGCTKVTHISGDRQTQSRRTHRKIFSGAALRPEVMLVKLADRLHNLRTLQAMPKAKRQRIAEETLAIYAPLAGALGLFNMKREMYDLALLYKYPRQGGRLNHLIARLIKSALGKKVVKTLQEATAAAGENCEVDIRTKRLWAYYDVHNKVLLQKIDTPQEVVLLGDTLQECYSLLGLLNQTYPPIPRTIRDFISNPKQTGYQGLHARAIIEGQKFFFKIRTREMQRKAQRGLFKNWSSKREKQGRFIREIQEMFDILGSEKAVSYRDVIAASGVKEIYTYTPDGDLIYLPSGSSVLDFAFRVHTEIGLSCTGAMIRNRKVGSTHVLKDGDMVRILRAEMPVRFDQSMLMRCKTPRARAELARSFNLRRGKVTTEVGKSLFAQELARYGLTTDILEGTGRETLRKHFSAESFKLFYRGIGEGKYRLRHVMEGVITLLNNGISKRIEGCSEFNQIELKTLDPVTVKLSSCCKPDPTHDDNVGLLTPGGISIHRPQCLKYKKLNLQREDIVEVRWEKHDTHVRKSQMYYVLKAGRKELLEAMASAPAEMKVLHLEVLTTAFENPPWELVFKVHDLSVLQKVNAHFAHTSIPIEFELEV